MLGRVSSQPIRVFVSSVFAIRSWELFSAIIFTMAGFLAGNRPNIALANNSPELPIDHPLIVLAAAGTDRLYDRAHEVMQAGGHELTRDEFRTSLETEMIIGGKSWPATQIDQSIDSTRPFGFFLFFGKSSDLTSHTEPVKSDSNNPNNVPKRDDESDPDDEANRSNRNANLSGSLLELLASDDSVVQKVAYFLPVRDFDNFLKLARLTRVPRAADCFVNEKGQEQFIRRFGDYIVSTYEWDIIEFCPDPRELVSRVLGTNDVAASFQTKGLPKVMRDLVLNQMKATFDQTLEQGEDESDRLFNLRHTGSEILRELLDVVLSHVDEANLGFGIEPKTLRLNFAFDLNGPINGPLAKLASEWKPKASPLDPAFDPTADLSLGLSLGVPERHAKPIAKAIRNYIATAKDDEKKIIDVFAPAIETGCRILESGELNIFMTTTGDGSSGYLLIGIQIPDRPDLPRQFQKFIEATTAYFEDQIGLELFQEGNINDWPVHRISLRHLFTKWFATSSESKEVTRSEFGDADAKATITTTSNTTWSIDTTKLPMQARFVATPRELWLEMTSNPKVRGIPEHLTAAVNKVASDRLRASAEPSQTPIPLRIMLRTRNATFGGKVTVKDENGEIIPQQQDDDAPPEGRKKDPTYEELYATKSDTILIEVSQSHRGLRMTARFDEIYMAILTNQTLRDELGESLSILFLLFSL